MIASNERIASVDECSDGFSSEDLTRHFERETWRRIFNAVPSHVLSSCLKPLFVYVHPFVLRLTDSSSFSSYQGLRLSISDLRVVVAETRRDPHASSKWFKPTLVQLTQNRLFFPRLYDEFIRRGRNLDRGSFCILQLNDMDVSKSTNDEIRCLRSRILN